MTTDKAPRPDKEMPMYNEFDQPIVDNFATEREREQFMELVMLKKRIAALLPAAEFALKYLKLKEPKEFHFNWAPAARKAVAQAEKEGGGGDIFYNVTVLRND